MLRRLNKLFHSKPLRGIEYEESNPGPYEESKNGRNMSGDAYELTKELKARARELGFDAVGVCKADEFSSDREFLVSRERRGIAPSPFEWPDVDERVEPSRILPGVQSIVAVAMTYLCHDEPEVGGGLRGELSRYC